MYLIVGLGNPGAKYELSFHNLGFLTIEYLSRNEGIKLKTSQCKSLTGTKFIGGKKLIIAQPQTYMNLSGQAVRELVAKFKIQKQNLLVIYDDIDIERGTIRYRESGSAGTHNGMRDIIQTLGYNDFGRIRIGIGKPPESFELADYVLSNIPKTESELYLEAVKAAAQRAMELAKAALT